MGILTAGRATAQAARLRTVVVVLAAVAFLQSPSFPQNSKSLTMVHDSGVSPLVDQPNSARDSGSFRALPATFSGDLPCADCAGIRYHLNLFPDHLFLSRMVYQARSGALDDLGTWEVTKDGKTLLLNGRHGA